jgi:hypothetical protein
MRTSPNSQLHHSHNRNDEVFDPLRACYTGRRPRHLARPLGQRRRQREYLRPPARHELCLQLPRHSQPSPRHHFIYNTNFTFIQSVSSNDIRCNAGGSKGVSGKCPVAAGDTVTVEMHQQNGDRSCKNEAIGGAHYGPVMVYMSKVDDSSKADGSSGWFKSRFLCSFNNPSLT